MAPEPIRISGGSVDLSPRVLKSTAITGSPADATETIVCTLAGFGDIAALSGVLLFGFVAFTVGASGTGANVKIRRTNAAGQTIAASGVVNEGITAAAQLGYRHIQGFDTGPTLPGQVYVLTLTVAAGSAASTVSETSLIAVAV